MIGRAGGHRAIALLVIGDAVLGGAFVAALVRPASEVSPPGRVVTATSVPVRAVAPQPYVNDSSAADFSVLSTTVPSTTTTSPASTTVPTTTRPAGLSSQDATTTTTTTTVPATITTTTEAPPPRRSPPPTAVVG